MSSQTNGSQHESVPAWRSFGSNRQLVIAASPVGIPSVFGKRASGARPLLSWEERVSLSLLVSAAVFYEVEQDDIELWLRDELWIGVATNGTRPVTFTDACHTLGIVSPPEIVRIINFIRCSEPMLRLLSRVLPFTSTD